MQNRPPLLVGAENKRHSGKHKRNEPFLINRNIENPLYCNELPLNRPRCKMGGIPEIGCQSSQLELTP